jgi:hypothetical protein
MNVPPWALAVFLAFALGQFALVAMWMMRADRRLALSEQKQTAMADVLNEIRVDIRASNLAVLVSRVDRLEHESAEHKMAHGRNRERIEDLRNEMLTLYTRATAKPTPRSDGNS